MNRRDQVTVTRQAVFERGLVHASTWPPLPASPSRPARFGKRARRRRCPGDFGGSLNRPCAESGMNSIVKTNRPGRSRPSPQQPSLAKSACAEVSGSHELAVNTPSPEDGFSARLRGNPHASRPRPVPGPLRCCSTLRAALTS